MPQVDVKAEGQHFRLYAGPHQGRIVARVWDFALSKDVLDETTSSVDEAKNKCEEWLKGRIKECPPIEWRNPQPTVFAVT